MIQRADRLIGLEHYREVLEALTARQLAVVALVLDGLSLAEAAEMLGISRRAAQRRLECARARLLREMPELADRLRGSEGACNAPVRDRG